MNLIWNIPKIFLHKECIFIESVIMFLLFFYFQDSDVKIYEIKDLNATPLQTASVSVRALIEDKIILKRISKPSATIKGHHPYLSLHHVFLDL